MKIPILCRYVENYNLLNDTSSPLTLIEKYNKIIDSLNPGYESMYVYDMIIDDCLVKGDLITLRTLCAKYCDQLTRKYTIEL
jgi:hypothetical protein